MNARTRVLLVEDNPGDADLTTDRLTETDVATFDVQRTTTLGAAMALLTSTGADAVIVDLNLPDSQGMTTISQVLRVAGPAAVIVVSGTVDDTLRRSISEAGADDVYTKDEANSRLFPRSLLHVIERRRARERQQQVEALVDTTPDAILVVNDAGIVRYVNNAASSLFRRSRENFVGEALGFVVRDLGTPTEIRVTTEGDPKICEMRVVRFQWQGEPALVAVLRDVTQQRHLEAQLLMTDRLISMGTLAAGIAHEINNPLAAVIANVTIALEEVARMPTTGLGTGELLDGLRDTRDAAQQIRQIVRDLKVYARDDEDVRQEFDLHRMLDSVARMAWHEVRQRARLVKDYGGVLTIVGSESRMSQVFLNLVINAAQAIGPGSAEQNEIRILTSRGPDGHVIVEVRDTGSGIAPEVQRRLFTPFVTTKPVGSGTGLGLAICQRIVSSVGGEITFTTEVDKGTTFRVWLPRVAPSAAGTDDAPTSPASVRSPQQVPIAASGASPVLRGRVLAIDDDTMVLHSLRRILGRTHHIECEERAVAALARIQAGEEFDIILCDLMMPEMTGVAFCTALEAVSPLQAQRLVFLTGGAVNPEAHEFLEHSEHVRVDKPFDLAMLRALVARYVG